MKSMRSLAVRGALLAALASLTGCKLIDTIREGIHVAERELVNTEDILNRAIADVNADAANWERAVNKALNDLPKAERQVREDLEQLSQRAIAGAGIEARCDISFMRDMVVGGLKAALAKVRGETPPPEHAVICNASPSAIDMNLDQNSRNNVEVYGYGLSEPAVRLIHVTKTAQYDVTPKFAVLSEFKRVVNLGANGVPMLPETVKLRIELGSGSQREITVIQKWPEVCKTRDYNTNTGLVTVVPARRGSGDAEFNGNGPCVRAVARVRVSPDRSRLLGNVTAEMWECPDDPAKIKWDYSQASGTSQGVLFTTDSTEEIVELRSPSEATMTFIDTNHAIDTVQAGGALLKWNLVGDTDGSDIGKSYVTAIFAPAKVVLKQKVDCVTEEELARLKNEGAMSAPVVSYLQSNAPGVMQRAAAELAAFNAQVARVQKLEADPQRQLRIREALGALEKRTQERKLRDEELVKKLVVPESVDPTKAIDAQPIPVVHPLGPVHPGPGGPVGPGGHGGVVTPNPDK